MTDFFTWANAMKVGLLMMIFGLVFCPAIWIAHDEITRVLIGAGMDAGQGSSWDDTANLNIQESLFAFILVFPAPIGAGIMLLASFKRGRRDQYYEAGAVYGNAGASTPTDDGWNGEW